MSDEDITNTVWNRELTCYKDSDVSDGVCGECGRPVCGDHRKRLHDSTFHYYTEGSKRAVAVLIGLIGIPVLFTQVFPDLVPSMIRAVVGRPLLFTNAVVQSSVIVAVALGLTLRFQSGQHRGDFRLIKRRAADRDFCDECYEDTFLQRALYYGLVVIAAVLVLMGLRDLINQAVFLPLRTMSFGVAVWILRDDIVTYTMHAIESEKQTVDDVTEDPEGAHHTTQSADSQTAGAHPSDGGNPTTRNK